jgi:glycerol-3-phosphate acyltransferase PlsY
VRLALAVAAAYALGGIPFAVLAGRLRGIDLTRHGSGNPGATNAIRVLGAAIGVPVLLLDVAKGFAAVAGIAGLAGGGDIARLACGGAAIAGHVAPPWLRFRGGKGVAAAAGAFLALAPAATGAAALAFAAVLVAFRYVSLASLAAAAVLPIACAWLGATRAVLGAACAVFALVLLRHRGNLARLAAGTESRIRLRARSGAS